MTKEFSRSEQLAALIQRQLSLIIQRKLNDPRVNSLVSVSAVTITRDLSYAKVYVTSLDTDEDNIKELIAVLNRAAGFMRSELSRELTTRKVPQLKFVYDTSITYANRLSRMIDDALDSDDTQSKE